MTREITKLVSIDGGKVRLSDSDLHRLACKAIWEFNDIVFESMPSLIAQIIENKAWRNYQHKDFASYALDATSNGLGVNTNLRLWLLRCSLDVHGKHINEWAEVLAKVEEMVKLVPIKERGAIGGKNGGFNGNSLETLAKECGSSNTDRITYLPSRSGSNHDGHLVRLRKNKPDVFKRVVSGELSVVEARRAADMGIKPTDLVRAKSTPRTEKKLAKQIEHLEKVVAIVEQTGNGISEIEIPRISPEHAKELAGQIKRSRAALLRFENRLRGLCT